MDMLLDYSDMVNPLLKTNGSGAGGGGGGGDRRPNFVRRQLLSD